MSMSSLLLGFALNLVIALVIVRGIYYPACHDRNHIFTFLAFNTVVYFVMTFLANAQLSLGVGFGLFAIFSLLRYRTREISTREMTYLFILIALPVMNSVLMSSGSWAVLLTANSAVIVLLFVLEQGWGFHGEDVQRITYERIELIRPELRQALLDDLRQRTGLPVTRVEIRRINFVDDSAELLVYHDEVNAQDRPVAHTDEVDRIYRLRSLDTQARQQPSDGLSTPSAGTYARDQA